MVEGFEKFLVQVLRIRHLSAAQLVYVRVVFDGADPCDLSDTDREIASVLFGEVNRVPAHARHVVCTLKGARIGGTWLHSLYLLYVALTADLSTLAAGEVAFAIIVAPDLRLARQALRYVSGAAAATPSITSLVAVDNTESLVLRRPQDGRQVAIECLPATRGGSAVRGRTLVAALLDEACFFRDESAVVNASEIYRAVAPRILPGGLLAMISTVWSDAGDLLWDRVQANHGNPQSCLAAICPTLTMRNDDRIRQVVAEERERDEENAAREFDCQPFTGGAGYFFDHAAIRMAEDPGLPLVMLPTMQGQAGIGVDVGLVSDSSAGVAVHEQASVFTVAEIVEMRPQRGQPLKLSEVCAALAALTLRHGCSFAFADHHELEPSKEHLEPHHVQLEAMPGGNAGKFEAYTKVRGILNEGRLRIPQGQRKLLRQLRDVCSKPMPGGIVKIWSPRKRSSGHGDIVSALVNGVWALQSASDGGLWRALNAYAMRLAAEEHAAARATADVCNDARPLKDRQPKQGNEQL